MCSHRATISFTLQRHGGIAHMTWMLSWIAMALFRKDRTAKGGGGAAFYFRAELECISASERITNELRAYE